MSVATVVQLDAPEFTWIDIVNPTADELREAAAEYSLFPTLVADSLQPDHLPKFEQVGDVAFFIVRAFDDDAPADGSTIQQLTRKIAIFCTTTCVITIHRRDQKFLVDLRKQYGAYVQTAAHRKGGERRKTWPLRLVLEILNAAVTSYEAPLDAIEDRLDAIEDELFDAKVNEALLRETYQLKRRITLMRRMLWQTESVLTKYTPVQSPSASLYQDSRELVESMHGHADELLETANNLLHIHLGLAANRTNRIVRVLTVFSVFFMPLTFIVGVYGMNFRFMPELWWHFGYAAVWVAMAVVTLAIFIWFRRRGFLRE